MVLFYHALTCKQTFVHVMKIEKFCNDVSRIYHLSYFAHLVYCGELNYDQYFICFFIVIFHEKMFPFLCYSPRSKKSRLLQHVNRKIERLFQFPPCQVFFTSYSKVSCTFTLWNNISIDTRVQLSCFVEFWTCALIFLLTWYSTRVQWPTLCTTSGRWCR